MKHRNIDMAKKPEKDKLLESFMKEFFPYGEFKRAGIFTKEMKGDYPSQAQRICNRLGLNSIYEYGKDEIVCHISYDSGLKHDKAGVESATPMFVNNEGELKEEPFVTVIPSIYD